MLPCPLLGMTHRHPGQSARLVRGSLSLERGHPGTHANSLSALCTFTDVDLALPLCHTTWHLRARARFEQLPQWFRMKTDNKIKWNAKRRHWRRTKLKL